MSSAKTLISLPPLHIRVPTWPSSDQWVLGANPFPSYQAQSAREESLCQSHAGALLCATSKPDANIPKQCSHFLPTEPENPEDSRATEVMGCGLPKMEQGRALVLAPYWPVDVRKKSFCHIPATDIWKLLPPSADPVRHTHWSLSPTRGR